MRVAFLDPFSGASGDMILGALIDAGVDLSAINAGLAKLNLPTGRIEATKVTRNGITGTMANVPEGDDHHRSWSDIRGVIERSGLDAGVKADALRVFERLATAESAVHAVSVEEVHFHEVGALDTIVDIVGAVLGFRMLDVERLYCGPLHLGGGSVHTAHGRLPVPAPATATILAAVSAPIAPLMPGEADAGELLTPTAAALVATLATFDRPSMTIEAVGTGFGSKELPWANITRLLVGEASPVNQEGGEPLSVLETNIDDMNPQFVELLVERLFAGGALDVWTTPIAMKKNRPALQISALARPADAESLAAILIEQSTTLGVRQSAVSRIAADRQLESVVTRWGPVRIKLKLWQGRVADIAPEYDDCLTIARAEDIRIREVWNEAYRIGEVYIGRRLGQGGELARLDLNGSPGAR